MYFLGFFGSRASPLVSLSILYIEDEVELRIRLLRKGRFNLLSY
jgi:hypothetical protein